MPDNKPKFRLSIFAIMLISFAYALGLVTPTIVDQIFRPVPEIPENPFGPIVIASTTIRMGDSITPQKTRLERWPVEFIPEGAFTDRKAILGKRTISEIIIGAPIMPKDVE